MSLKIGVMSSIDEAETLYSHFAADRAIDLLFRFARFDNAMEAATELQDIERVDAIITLGIPLEIFTLDMNIPIYPIYPSNYDIIRALFEGSKYGRRIAFAKIPFTSVLYDWDAIIKMFGFDVTHANYSVLTHAMLERDVNDVVAGGFDVLVTMGGYTHYYAKKIGFPTVMVTAEQQSFQMTLERLEKDFRDRRIAEDKRRWLSSIIDNSDEGILVLDEKGCVMVINSAAQLFMRLNQSDIIGKHVDEIVSTNPLFLKFLNVPGNLDVVKSRTREYVIKKDKLYAGDQVLGTKISARAIQDVQSLELTTRRKIHDQGFVANNTFLDIKGNGELMGSIKAKAKSYAKSSANILLYGESGSGKELFAQSIHNESTYVNGPFVAVNCAALPLSLLESELFGYEEGAFTGARKGGKAGLFEMAHKGTLFLDEIGDIPLDIQSRLLRVLQERTVMRIGGSKNIPVDVRFIFATNKDLRAAVSQGTFREDLYYRIRVLILHIPALRQHKEDIPEIAGAIMLRLSADGSGAFPLSESSLQVLMQYDWPGNIRELSNALESSYILGRHDERVFRKHLRETLWQEDAINEQSSPSEEDRLSVKIATLHTMENEIIDSLYQRYSHNKHKVEHVLNISESSLYRRLREIKLTKNNANAQGRF